MRKNRYLLKKYLKTLGVFLLTCLLLNSSLPAFAQKTGDTKVLEILEKEQLSSVENSSLTQVLWGMANPAAVYCQDLGYEYKIIEEHLGQDGICQFPTGKSCGAWDFLKGKCGQNFSYCAKHGYDIKTVKEVTTEYAICVSKATGKEIGKVADLTNLIQKSTFALAVSCSQADVNGDGKIDFADATQVFNRWGNTGGPEDVNQDGVVNGVDISIVFSCWGPVPSPTPTLTPTPTVGPGTPTPTSIPTSTPVPTPTPTLTPTLTLTPTPTVGLGTPTPTIPGPTLTPTPTPTGMPSSFDWRNQGGVTSIKDQGWCGSCWAFATVAPFESNIKIKDGIEKNLSEQYLVSCNTDGYGCGGGGWAHSYHLNKIPPGEPDAGAVYEADFPYVARDTSCNPPHPHHEKIDSWAYVGPRSGIPSVDAIKQAIYTYGPVSAAICSGYAFQSYTGGVFETNERCGFVTNHAIVLVGWDDNQGTNGVWILRNSWGRGWGESGYMRIGYGISLVGYAATYVSYSPRLPTPTPSPTPTPTISPSPTPTVGPGTPTPTISPTPVAFYKEGKLEEAMIVSRQEL